MECQKGNKLVFRVDDYEKRMWEKIALENKRTEDERIEKELQDDRWKICPGGHCYENIKTHCRWCESGEVVGRLDRNVEIASKFLYVGKRDGVIVMTGDETIEIIGKRIKSIKVDYHGDYIFYFHMDGINPHPFKSNTIRLNEQLVIPGRELTLACEEIIAGRQTEVVLKGIVESPQEATSVDVKHINKAVSDDVKRRQLHPFIRFCAKFRSKLFGSPATK
jgi:hypothetical protein